MVDIVGNRDDSEDKDYQVGVGGDEWKWEDYDYNLQGLE